MGATDSTTVGPLCYFGQMRGLASGLPSHALIVALSVALLDGWIGVFSGVDLLAFLLGGVWLVAVAVFPLAIVAMLVPPPRTVSSRDPTGLAWRAAAPVTLAAGLLCWRLLGYPWSQVSRFEPTGAGLILVLAVVVGWMTFQAGLAVLARPDHGRRVRARACMLPWILAYSCAIAWLMTHGLASGISLQGSALTLVWLLGVVALLWAASRPLIQRHALTLLTTFALMLSAAALWAMRPAQSGGTGDTRIAATAVERILLITVDTLRADSISAIEPGRTRTPHIDRLAGDGILFRQARSPASWTLPSVASMMTGLSPDVLEISRTTSKVRDHVMLAELLRNSGYATGAIGKNVRLRPEVGLTDGFGTYDFYPVPAASGRSIGSKLLRALYPARFASRTVSTTQLTDRAIEWIETHRANPFFLWLHYLDPHVPYAPPEDRLQGSPPTDRITDRFDTPQSIRNGRLGLNMAERAWLRELYDGEVDHVDEQLGRLFEYLDRHHLYDGALLIFASDHGEEFWEHGGYEHGHTLFDEVLRVPLIVKLPNSRVVETVDTPVSTTDLFATILDICGLENPHELSLSLERFWGKRTNLRVAEPVISSGLLYFDDQVSVVYNGFKYIRNLNTGAETLYDLRADPAETRSLVAEAPPSLDVAREIVRQHEETSSLLRRQLGLGPAEVLEIDEATRKLLKSVGYIN